LRLGGERQLLEYRGQLAVDEFGSAAVASEVERVALFNLRVYPLHHAATTDGAAGSLAIHLSHLIGTEANRTLSLYLWWDRRWLDRR
jgi:hypothetical protein